MTTLMAQAALCKVPVFNLPAPGKHSGCDSGTALEALSKTPAHRKRSHQQPQHGLSGFLSLQGCVLRAMHGHKE